MVTSLLIPSIASRFDRRHVLLALTGVMLTSLVLIAEAYSFTMLMAARALLGVTIGGFWSHSRATILRLVLGDSVTKALSVLFMGNAIASAFVAPISRYLVAVIRWRGVFWMLVTYKALRRFRNIYA